MSRRMKSYLSRTSTSALSSARSRPMSADSASSAPARSMDATAMSTSTDWITSEMGTRWTRTSNIERSIVSGFIPWLIVRLPCGSRSMRSTRFPSSPSATPRLSVVVVFATPPFWFANAMTLAVTAHPELRRAATRAAARGQREPRGTRAATPAQTHWAPAHRAARRADRVRLAWLAAARTAVGYGRDPWLRHLPVSPRNSFNADHGSPRARCQSSPSQ